MVTKKKKAERARARNTRANKEAQKIREQQEDYIEPEEPEEVEEEVEEEYYDEDPSLWDKIYTPLACIIGFSGVIITFWQPFVSLMVGTVAIMMYNYKKNEDWGEDTPRIIYISGVVAIVAAILGWILMLV